MAGGLAQVSVAPEVVFYGHPDTEMVKSEQVFYVV